MVIFYAPNIANSPILPEEESLHCVKVLRMQVGEIVNIIDGMGTLYEAEIVVSHHKRTEVKILKSTSDFAARPYNLHLAVAPTKNIDRFEWFVEKATEIGFDTLTPLLCRYSERKIIKPERIEKILVSASKQSYKAKIPQLNPMITIKEFIANMQDDNNQRFIAHCYDQPKEFLFRACAPSPQGGDVVVMVGPEGDFSEEEVLLALENRFKAVTLGESRLRTETASVVACHLISVLNS